MIKLSTAAACGALSLCALAAAPAQADEPLFGYVYTTDVVPAGKTEVEAWSTFREGRSEGHFDLWQGRLELSHGITNNIQLSGYLNVAHTSVRGDVPGGDTLPPEVFADYNVDPSRPFHKTRFESASGEAIWRISSPYLNPIGLAVYIEPTIGPRTYELETRFIAQKNFIDDRLVLAANVTYALEARHILSDDATPGLPDQPRVWDHETDVNIGLAGSYRFAPKLSAGAEFLNEREWAGFDATRGSKATNVAYYAGPNFHFGGQHLFATATFLWQLPWAHDLANPKSDDAVVHGISNADDFEKYRLRLKVGYNF